MGICGHFPRAQDHIANRLSSSDQERLFAEKTKPSEIDNVLDREGGVSNIDAHRGIIEGSPGAKHSLFHSKAKADSSIIENRLNDAESRLVETANASLQSQDTFVRVTDKCDDSVLKHKASRFETRGRATAHENISRWDEKSSIIAAQEHRSRQPHVAVEETKLQTSSMESSS